MSMATACDVANRRDLDAILLEAQLPALPASALRLIELSKDPRNGPEEYAKPIEIDPSLNSQVLRFANSSYFGFSREIASVKQALTLIGVRPICNFALWSAIYSLIPNPTYGEFELKVLWQDSVRRAVFARVCGRRLQLGNVEELFAAALLQDVAIPVLLIAVPGEYERLITQDASSHGRLSELEQQRFGWDHAIAGAKLCRNWHLPEEVSNMIESHIDISHTLTAPITKIDYAIVSLSSLLPSFKQSEWTERTQFLVGMSALLGDDSEKIESLIEQVDAAFDDFAPMLNMRTANQTISDWLEAKG